MVISSMSSFLFYQKYGPRNTGMRVPDRSELGHHPEDPYDRLDRRGTVSDGEKLIQTQ
jgi:hypothetical protein